LAIAVLASAWRRVRSSTSSLAPISQRSQPLELGPGLSLELAGLAQPGARAGSGAACNLGRVFPLALLGGADRGMLHDISAQPADQRSPAARFASAAGLAVKYPCG